MTEPNPVNELLKLVDVLTKDHTVIVDDKGGQFLGSREERPLLVKLSGAVASNLGGSGSGAPGRERTPINVGAADLHNRIDSAVWGWLQDMTAPAGRPRVDVNLRQWFIRYVNLHRSQQVSEDAVWGRVRLLESWVQQITDLLDPPFRWALTSPCPHCGQEWVNRYSDDYGEVERVRALNAVERESFTNSYVICVGCEKVWHASQARQLRIAIDDADTARKVASA